MDKINDYRKFFGVAVLNIYIYIYIYMNKNGIHYI